MDNLQNEDNKNFKEIDILEFARVQKIFFRRLTTSIAVTLFSSVDTYNTKKCMFYVYPLCSTLILESIIWKVNVLEDLLQMHSLIATKLLIIQNEAKTDPFF